VAAALQAAESRFYTARFPSEAEAQ
jgi:hypothetical protein